MYGDGHEHSGTGVSVGDGSGETAAVGVGVGVRPGVGVIDAVAIAVASNTRQALFIVDSPLVDQGGGRSQFPDHGQIRVKLSNHFDDLILAVFASGADVP